MTDRSSEDRSPQHDFVLRSIGPSWMPPFGQVTSVSVVPVLGGGTSSIVAVRLREQGFDIPGGHTTTSDGNPEETARRECMEEACIGIDDFRLVDVIESDYYGKEPQSLTYMIIYAARVSRMHPFAPGDEAVERRAMSPDEFLHSYAGSSHELMRTWVRAAFNPAGS